MNGTVRSVLEKYAGWVLTAITAAVVASVVNGLFLQRDMAGAEEMQGKHHTRINILERNQAVLDRSQREVEADVQSIKGQVDAIADAVGAERTPDVAVRPSELEHPPE